MYIRGVPCGNFSRLNYLKSRKFWNIIIEKFKEILLCLFDNSKLMRLNNYFRNYHSS